MSIGFYLPKQNGRLSTALWNVPWYLLPPMYQRMLQSILNRIQNGARLTIGPFAELNMETATDVSNCFWI